MRGLDLMCCCGTLSTGTHRPPSSCMLLYGKHYSRKVEPANRALSKGLWWASLNYVHFSGPAFCVHVYTTELLQVLDPRVWVRDGDYRGMRCTRCCFRPPGFVLADLESVHNELCQFWAPDTGQWNSGDRRRTERSLCISLAAFSGPTQTKDRIE